MPSLKRSGARIIGPIFPMLMAVGFLAMWFLPVVGCLVMVAGAIKTAIGWEADLVSVESDSGLQAATGGTSK